MSVLDGLYRQIASVDPKGGRTSYAFDPAGNLTSLTDPLGYETTWAYDPRGRAIKETIQTAVSPSPIYDHRKFVYDTADQLTQKVDRLNRSTTYQYDGLGRLTTETAGTHVITFGFDVGSQLTSVTDVDGAATLANYAYLYDQLGRTSRVTASNLAGLTNAYVLDQAYDSRGNRKQLKATVQGKFDLQNDYSYDALSRLTTLQQTKQGTGGSYNVVADKRVDFAYDAAGQWQNISRYSTLGTTALVAATNFPYDRVGRLTGLSHQRSNNEIAGYQYAYDPVGRLTRIDSSIDEVSQFSYDRTGQLTGAQNTFEQNEVYSYDANGNRIGTNYVTDRYNRVVSDPNYTYHYDAEGNRDWRVDRTSGDKEEYTWDHRNRLTDVTFKNSAGAIVQKIGYTYDAFDRLVRRAVDKTSTFDYADAALEYYGYDGQDLLFDISDPDGPNIGQSPAIKRRYLHGPAIDQILAQETAGGETLWMLTDHQGSVRDLVRNDGTIAAHYQYDSFGKPLDGLESITAFGMNGQRRDTATGFIYAIGRWYDPVAGRWLSEDLSLGPDSNPYRYVHNSAANFVDSNGRQEHGSWTDGSGSLDSMIIDAVVGGPYYGESAFANGVPVDWEEGLRNLPKDSRGLPLDTSVRYIALVPRETSFDLGIDGAMTLLGIKAIGSALKYGGKGAVTCAANADDAVRWAYRVLTTADTVKSGVDEGKSSGEIAMDLGANAAEALMLSRLRRMIRPTLGAKSSTSGENAAAVRGRQAHRDHDYGPSFNRTVVLPSGKRPDAVDVPGRVVVELKPNNARAIRKGERQAQCYADELEQVFPGSPFTVRVETYDP